MKTVSIGFTRDDGDFQIIATLNNNDELIDSVRFIATVSALRQTLQAASNEALQILERQDSPDYITL